MNTQEQHTAEPWRYTKRDDDHFGISAGWLDIALVFNRDDDPADEARARLIASCPDMLAALDSAALQREGWQEDVSLAIGKARESRDQAAQGVRDG